MPAKHQFEIGDFVEVLSSISVDLIGKVFRVCQVDQDTVGLEGITANQPYLFNYYKLKFVRKATDSIIWTKPNLPGNNCISCSKFSEYQETPFTCFECQNV